MHLKTDDRQASTEALAKLRDFLGRDTLGTRTANALTRDSRLWPSIWDISTVEGLRTAYLDEQGRNYLENIRLIGPAAMARIAERCTQTDT